MIAGVPVYKVTIVEEIRLIKEVYVSAWSEKAACSCVEDLLCDGDEQVEPTMDDFDERIWSDIDAEVQTDTDIQPEIDASDIRYGL